METIRIFVESLIQLTGLTGSAVPIVRHIALVIVAVLLAWSSGYLGRRLLIPLIHKITAHTAAQWDDQIFNDRVLRSACRIIPALVIRWLLPMVFYQFPIVRDILERLTDIYITIMSVRMVTALLTSVQQLNTAHSSSAHQYLQSFCGVLKIIVIFIAVIIVAAIILDKNPSTLFAGLGATSAILMLVFKDTIEGLVAGIRLTSNEMLHKGEWITVASAGADGTVDEMTLTTVKVRNFDNSITTVSPLTLVNGSFQNWKTMQEGAGRRVKRKLFFDFRSIKIADETLKEHLRQHHLVTEEQLKDENVVNLTLFRAYMEKMLSESKEVNADMTLMVRQLEPTVSGLPIEFYFFIATTVWTDFEHAQADLMERIYALVPEFGLKVYQQYPMQ
ncbi:transporter, small conductance mechanosensitive ion channel MscS family protein [Prevotella sp. DNF00663]|uniref:mechanosensitive ion channel family protein n=1 Tax=Prevotella sp. DNF00663 TaxID=1384078 RepID=UPI000782EFB3|nr:mechanosensitive ion channel domain-containing protein [Prevotella sp. DNF00663]KXB78585.1 transporter, small conductance mechanosensitive ion channel MscS family protein [Prevotella sp. DNF00663]